MSEGWSIKVAMTSRADLISSLVTSVMMGASASNNSQVRSGVVPGLGGAVGLTSGAEMGAGFASGSATKSGGAASNAEERGAASGLGVDMASESGITSGVGVASGPTSSARAPATMGATSGNKEGLSYEKKDLGTLLIQICNSFSIMAQVGAWC